MANLTAKMTVYENGISLCRDLKFMQWRFLNPRVNYLFYYIWDSDKSLKSYIVVKYYRKSGAGKIVDYAYTDINYLQKVLELIISNKHFPFIFILDVNLDNALSKVLYDFGFHSKDLIAKLLSKKGKIARELCYVIKPLKDKSCEDYWFIDNLDTRKTKNWKFTEICSEDV